MQKLTVNATIDQIRPVTDFVNAQLENEGCSLRVTSQVDIAIDEIFSNIANYAYGADKGEATVCVEILDEPLRVVIRFIDSGTPYDPLSTEHRDTTRLALEERPIGGLGVYLVKRIMDDVSYEYKDGQNILTISKKI